MSSSTHFRVLRVQSLIDLIRPKSKTINSVSVTLPLPGHWCTVGFTLSSKLIYDRLHKREKVIQTEMRTQHLHRFMLISKMLCNVSVYRYFDDGYNLVDERN